MSGTLQKDSYRPFQESDKTLLKNFTSKTSKETKPSSSRNMDTPFRSDDWGVFRLVSLIFSLVKNLDTESVTLVWVGLLRKKRPESLITRSLCENNEYDHTQYKGE